MSKRFLGSFIFLLLGLTSTIGAVENCVQEQKVLASDGELGDQFGYNISISGDVAVIVARLDDNENGVNSGSAYVFRDDGAMWIEEAKLLPSDGEAGDELGGASISGDVIVLGTLEEAVQGGPKPGSAYVFRYNGATWIEEATLTADDGANHDIFGNLVEVSGDVALVAAAFDDDNGVDSGSAYVFRYDGATWNQEQKLLPSDGAAGDHFSAGLSLSGDVALLGSTFHDNNGIDSGAAYVFRYDGATWNQEQKLLASDGAAGDHFGSIVSVSGDVAVVGAGRDDDNGMNSGSAYVFRYDGATWNQEQKLLPNDGAAEDQFGTPRVSNDVIMVTARHDDDNGMNSGSAYIFRCVETDEDEDEDEDGGSIIHDRLDSGHSGDGIADLMADVDAFEEANHTTRSGKANRRSLRSTDRNSSRTVLDNQLRNMASPSTSEEARRDSEHALLSALSHGHSLETQLKIVRTLVGRLDSSLNALLIEHVEGIRVEADALGRENVSNQAERLLSRLRSSPAR